MGDVCSADDLTRAEMAREMFFASWTMPPNLIQTDYAFTDPSLRKAIDEFRGDLRTARDAVSGISKDFMPLETDPKNPDGPPYRTRTSPRASSTSARPESCMR